MNGNNSNGTDGYADLGWLLEMEEGFQQQNTSPVAPQEGIVVSPIPACPIPTGSFRMPEVHMNQNGMAQNREDNRNVVKGQQKMPSSMDQFGTGQESPRFLDQHEQNHVTSSNDQMYHPERQQLSSSLEQSAQNRPCSLSQMGQRRVAANNGTNAHQSPCDMTFMNQQQVSSPVDQTVPFLQHQKSPNLLGHKNELGKYTRSKYSHSQKSSFSVPQQLSSSRSPIEDVYHSPPRFQTGLGDNDKPAFEDMFQEQQNWCKVVLSNMGCLDEAMAQAIPPINQSQGLDEIQGARVEDGMSTQQHESSMGYNNAGVMEHQPPRRPVELKKAIVFKLLAEETSNEVYSTQGYGEIVEMEQKQSKLPGFSNGATQDGPTQHQRPMEHHGMAVSSSSRKRICSRTQEEVPIAGRITQQPEIQLAEAMEQGVADCQTNGQHQKVLRLEQLEQLARQGYADKRQKRSPVVAPPMPAMPIKSAKVYEPNATSTPILWQALPNYKEYSKDKRIQYLEGLVGQLVTQNTALSSMLPRNNHPMSYSKSSKSGASSEPNTSSASLEQFSVPGPKTFSQAKKLFDDWATKYPDIQNVQIDSVTGFSSLLFNPDGSRQLPQPVFAVTSGAQLYKATHDWERQELSVKLAYTNVANNFVKFQQELHGMGLIQPMSVEELMSRGAKATGLSTKETTSVQKKK